MFPRWNQRLPIEVLFNMENFARCFVALRNLEIVTKNVNKFNSGLFYIILHLQVTKFILKYILPKWLLFRQLQEKGKNGSKK